MRGHGNPTRAEEHQIRSDAAVWEAKLPCRSSHFVSQLEIRSRIQRGSRLSAWVRSQGIESIARTYFGSGIQAFKQDTTFIPAFPPPPFLLCSDTQQISGAGLILCLPTRRRNGCRKKGFWNALSSKPKVLNAMNQIRSILKPLKFTFCGIKLGAF